MTPAEHRSVGSLVAADIRAMMERRFPTPKVSCQKCKGEGFCPAPGTRHGNKFCSCEAGKAARAQVGFVIRGLDVPSVDERERKLGFLPPTSYRPDRPDLD